MAYEATTCPIHLGESASTAAAADKTDAGEDAIGQRH